MSDENKNEAQTEKERIEAEINNSDGKPQNKHERLVNISFIIAIAGIITIGAFPFLGCFGLISSLVMSAKCRSGRAELSEFFKWKNKKIILAAIISFVLTAIDALIFLAVRSRLM